MATECKKKNADCVCNRANGHKGPHQCDCGGQWLDNGTIVRYPVKVVAEGPLRGVAVEDLLGPPPAVQL